MVKLLFNYSDVGGIVLKDEISNCCLGYFFNNLFRVLRILRTFCGVFRREGKVLLVVFGVFNRELENLNRCFCCIF